MQRPGEPRAADAPRNGSFFRFHGVWAPGIRLFRRLSFNTKALIISAVFAAPILILGTAYLTDVASRIAYTHREVDGLEQLGETLPLLRLAEEQRGRAIEAAQSGRADPQIDEGIRKYAEQRRRLQAGSATIPAAGEALERVVAELPPAPEPGTDSTEVYERYTQFASDQLAYIRAVLSQSNLMQDPDLVTGLLIKTILVRMPELTEKSSGIASLGKLALETGTLSGPQRRMITDSLPMTEYFDGEIAADLEQAVMHEPALKPALELGDSAPNAAELRGLARHYLLAGSSVSGDLGRYQKSGARAQQQSWSLSERGMQQIRSRLERRLQSARRNRDDVIALLVGSLALAAYLFWSFRKATEGGLRAVADHLDRMRRGDLTVRSTAWGSDEAAHVINAVEDMRTAFSSIIADVRHVSNLILEASADLEARSLALAENSSESVTQLERCDSAVHDITQSIDETLEMVAEATRLSSANAAAADAGQHAVNSQLSTMDVLAQSSVKVAEFTGVINSIAFQTNILALNAAVEAARAGEAGRGFAVVATEVRSLADRAAQAGREISALIDSNLERVRESVRISNETRDKMGSLVANAQRINERLGTISTGARQQSDRILGVKQALKALGNGTTASNTQAAHTAEAVQSLRETSETLAKRVSTFRMDSASEAWKHPDGVDAQDEPDEFLTRTGRAAA